MDPNYLTPGPETVVAIDEKDAVVERVPWFLELTPDQNVAALGTAVVMYTIPWRDFVVTEIGFTSASVGLPAAPGRWKVAIEDVGKSRRWQPHRWNITAFVGGNFGTGDNAARKLAFPWRFTEKGSLRVEFENLSALPNLPNLLLHGYLDIPRAPAIL